MTGKASPSPAGAPVGARRWPLACRQWQGGRPYQEDAFATVEIDPPDSGGTRALLLLLADGMGGAAGGAVASRVAVETFKHRVPSLRGPVHTRLRECLDATTAALQQRVETDPGLDGMGCTVVAALYDGQGVSWLSVGDSPMWLFADGRLERLNADHSMAPVLRRMVETGELSEEEARRDSRRNMLRSAVTSEASKLVDSAFRSCRLGPADYLLIASDGLETLSEAEIAQALRTAPGDQDNAADSLISAVRSAARPRQDNVTFLLLSGDPGSAGRVSQSPGAARRITRQWPGFAFGLATGGLLVALGLWQFGPMGSDAQSGPAPGTGPTGQPTGVTGSASETPRPASEPANPAAAAPDTEDLPAAHPPAKAVRPESETPAREPASPTGPSPPSGAEPAASPPADPVLEPEDAPPASRVERPAPGGGDE